MTRKPQITASLPEHISAEIESHAIKLQISKAEYLAQIAKWWYGKGSPPVSEEEERLAKNKENAKRVS